MIIKSFYFLSKSFKKEEEEEEEEFISSNFNPLAHKVKQRDMFEDLIKMKYYCTLFW